MSLRHDANLIIEYALKEVLPDKAVKNALEGKVFDTGKIYVVATGKAAYQMAKAASDVLRDRIHKGIVITKYDHIKGSIENFDLYEAGHPVPDENSFKATEKAIELVSSLNKEDTVLFLLSGGGSALFEKPLIEGKELQDITSKLLGCGAEITEINTIRKRLSGVKGGKFARICEPAHVYSIVLSDIIGDPLDMIASGPAYPDSSTSADAKNIIKKYDIKLSKEAEALMNAETPKDLNNVETIVTGSVKNLCMAVSDAAKGLGYKPVYLTDQLTCEAREAGSLLASIAKSHQDDGESLAYITGGETVVHLTGKGKGGRNQEIALGAAYGIKDLKGTCVFSLGSDGTDGPTDAAGGYVDSNTFNKLKESGVDVFEVLKNNDAYNALKKCDGLIMTGPTGTNVNDVSVVLIRR